MADEKPRGPRPGPSVYDLREPSTQTQEPRRIAEADEHGRLHWSPDWVQQATGWQPLDAFLRGR